MEQRGIVGPFEGSKPRQLLITREKWEEIKLRGGLGAMSSAAMAAQDAAGGKPAGRGRDPIKQKQRLTELPWGAVVLGRGLFSSSHNKI